MFCSCQEVGSRVCAAWFPLLRSCPLRAETVLWTATPRTLVATAEYGWYFPHKTTRMLPQTARRHGCRHRASSQCLSPSTQYSPLSCFSRQVCTEVDFEDFHTDSEQGAGQDPRTLALTASLSFDKTSDYLAGSLPAARVSPSRQTFSFLLVMRGVHTTTCRWHCSCRVAQVSRCGGVGVKDFSKRSEKTLLSASRQQLVSLTFANKPCGCL